jgi:tellurium resistance protein TerD
MAINLSKGQKVDLTKHNPSLYNLQVGLGWSINQFDTGADFDLDTSAFLVTGTGKVRQDSDFIFYNNKEHQSGAVTHTGDNLVGGSGGDDETILVDLSKVPDYVERIAFTVTIFEADKRRQTFGSISHAYIRIVDSTTDEEIVRYDLAEDFSVETAIVVGELYKHNGDWKFNAVGSGFAGGLYALCKNYGVNV